MKKNGCGLMKWGALVLIIPGMIFAQSMEKTSAKLYIQQKEWDKAIEWLQKALAKNATDPQTHFLLGQVYAEKGRLLDMAREFEEGKKLDTKNKMKKEKKQMEDMIRHFSAKSYNEGVEAYKQQDYSTAAERFLLATQLDPAYVDAHRNLSVAYQLVEQDIRREDPCSDCSAPGYTWDTQIFKCLDSATGQPARLCCCSKEALPDLRHRVVTTLETVIGLQPDSLIHTLVLADYFNSHDDHARSATLFEQALQKHPGNPKILARLADTYNIMGRAEEAFKMYDQALAADPDNKDLLYNYGQLFLTRNDYSHAVEQFRRLVELQNDDFGANFYLGVAYLKIAEEADKRARELQDEAASKRKKPNQAVIDSLKTVEKNNSLSAVPYLERATQLEGGNQPAVWTNLGIAYTRSGTTDKAKEAFDKAEALEKND
ncbi:MAG: tetratricopeptide repeat protein [candidate division KSB1 bacterium]|nr:tetratricopeptide repeat protein [candidate division KSB1 bacterium]MDZ7276448.1 tetratricopeptide repeat protein [candidate division KSB1 bacterium]MDZ7288117.1 tetratricopeptide repeat protein [candidate division KSB1 bacterium]MDZ7300218.1 tetratricopeptide repeat protein [candidate division KSB1 bacterium]MDZ7305789.1 tetratricopeptide repeat protein [candidate division KSB1 bacterium]